MADLARDLGWSMRRATYFVGFVERVAGVTLRCVRHHRVYVDLARIERLREAVEIGLARMAQRKARRGPRKPHPRKTRLDEEVPALMARRPEMTAAELARELGGRYPLNTVRHHHTAWRKSVGRANAVGEVAPAFAALAVPMLLLTPRASIQEILAALKPAGDFARSAVVPHVTKWRRANGHLEPRRARSCKNRRARPPESRGPKPT